MIFEDGECLVLDAFRGNVDYVHLLHLREPRVVVGCGLALSRHNLELRVHLREEGSGEIVETIEDAQHDDEGHRRHGDADNGYCRDDVDGVGTLLREEVAAGDVEGE